MAFERLKSVILSYPVTTVIVIFWFGFMAYFTPGILSSLSDSTSGSRQDNPMVVLDYSCKETNGKPFITLTWNDVLRNKNILERRIEGGEWEVILSETALPFSTQYTDILPGSSADTHYYRLRFGDDKFSNTVVFIPVSGCTIFPTN